MRCPECNETGHERGALYCHVCGMRLEQSCIKSPKSIGRLRLEWAESFSEGLAMVTLGGKTGYIDNSGKFVIGPQFDISGNYTFGNESVFGFSDGLAPFCIGNFPDKKYGCIDRHGTIKIPAQFDCIWQFSEGFAPFRTNKNDKWGFINDKGQTVIPALYEMVAHFSEGLAVVKLERDRFAFIDKTGKVAIEKTKNIVFKWDDGFPVRKGILQKCGSFHEGLAAIECAGKSGYINKAGSFISTNFDHTDNFSEGMAAFSIKINHISRWGYIDKRMNILIEPHFKHAGEFHENIAVVCDDRKFGYIDKRGNIIIACVYDKAANFKEGLAAVEINKKIGYIDITGSVVIPPRYDQARNFSEGLAAVSENGEWGYIDKSGIYVF